MTPLWCINVDGGFCKKLKLFLGQHFSAFLYKKIEEFLEKKISSVNFISFVFVLFLG
jgi:hypothetical protein